MTRSTRVTTNANDNIDQPPPSPRQRSADRITNGPSIAIAVSTQTPSMSAIEATIAQLTAMNEAAFQRFIVRAAHDYGWDHHHETYSMGSKPGFPDLVLWRPGSRFHTPRAAMFREIKTAKGPTKPAQTALIESMRLAGCDVEIWRPADWPVILDTLSAR